MTGFLKNNAYPADGANPYQCSTVPPEMDEQARKILHDAMKMGGIGGGACGVMLFMGMTVGVMGLLQGSATLPGIYGAAARRCMSHSIDQEIKVLLLTAFIGSGATAGAMAGGWKARRDGLILQDDSSSADPGRPAPG